MAVNTVKATINGTQYTLTKNTTTGKYEAAITAPGVTSYNVNSGHYYPVTITATDMAGNITSVTDSHQTLGANCKLRVKETVKPTIYVYSGDITEGCYVSNNKPMLEVIATDGGSGGGSGVDISTLVVKIDGTVVTTGVSTHEIQMGVKSYEVFFTPASALTDGAHTVTVDVKDRDGNSATTLTVHFTVDTVPPTLSVTSPATNGTYTNQTDCTVTGTTNDTASSVVDITITVAGGGNTDTYNLSNQSGNWSKAVTLNAGVTNTITVTATDKAGKYTTVTRTIICDTVAPTVSAITITPNPVNTGSTYTVSVTVSD